MRSTRSSSASFCAQKLSASLSRTRSTGSSEKSWKCRENVTTWATRKKKGKLRKCILQTGFWHVPKPQLVGLPTSFHMRPANHFFPKHRTCRQPALSAAACCRRRQQHQTENPARSCPIKKMVGTPPKPSKDIPERQPNPITASLEGTPGQNLKGNRIGKLIKQPYPQTYKNLKGKTPPKQPRLLGLVKTLRPGREQSAEGYSFQPDKTGGGVPTSPHKTENSCLQNALW